MSELFEAFPKIPRLKRDCVITEKLDGTNAQILIVPFTENDKNIVAVTEGLAVYVGSRKRWILPEGTTDQKGTDNFAFAGWVKDNLDDLIQLGEGRHFGEWWGRGIQRTYGMDDKVFSLFNHMRWGEHNPNTPSVCDVVPKLYQGEFNSDAIAKTLEVLSEGSVASAKYGCHYGDPEGVVIWHQASREYYKVTTRDDDKPKGKTV